MPHGRFKPTPTLTALWYQALEAEFGLELQVTPNEQVLVMNDLYASRAETGDPRLEVLMLTQMKDGTIWIVKREVNLEEAEKPNAPAF